MRIQRICKICGESFSAIKTTQFFCKRKCFKKDYYLRTKTNLQQQAQSPVYPMKKCGHCKVESRLDFDPLAFPKLFNAWGCPACGATNRLIWQYQSSPRSNYIISSMLLSLQSTFTQNTVPQYQTYHLPMPRPELGNPEVVVMTCEIMDILSIQKNNRKKIIFS